MTANPADNLGSQSSEWNAATKCTSQDADSCKARTFLRERFIRAMLAMNDKISNFHMYECTNVSGVFGSCDREFVNIYVKDLRTPLGTISHALLRTNDIERISINDINPSNNTLSS